MSAVTRKNRDQVASYRERLPCPSSTMNWAKFDDLARLLPQLWTGLSGGVRSHWNCPRSILSAQHIARGPKIGTVGAPHECSALRHRRLWLGQYARGGWRNHRSEERRVGKECRSRWSP